VPKAGSISPGSAEIAKMARKYWDAHVNGEKLPYCQPFEITELNVYARTSCCDFVIYREVGRKTAAATKQKYQVVADTRLFSGVQDAPAVKRRCAHVLLTAGGTAARITEAALRRRRITQMLPNVSCKEAVAYASPFDLLRGFGAVKKLGAIQARDLAQMTFLDLRSDVRKLDRFSIALGAPVRMLAVNCTSRYRRSDENRAPRSVRSHMTEQRLSKAGGDNGSKAVILCLQARTVADGSMRVDAVTNCEWDSKKCGARKAGKEKLVAAMSAKSVLKEARKRAAVAVAVPKPKKQKKIVVAPEKMAPHVRMDPCCGKDPFDSCEACAQMKTEHKDARLPPVGSSAHLYHPQKGIGSLLAEARSLGFCVIFPWLEDAIFRCNLVSCSAMDIETLNAPLAPGTLSGASTTLAGPDELSGGTTALTRHVPFVIGTTSFMWKATRTWTVSEMLWRLQGEATKYVEFRVEERDDVPGQNDVTDMVGRWMKYVEDRRRIIAAQKRKLMQPLFSMLRDMERRSNGYEERRSDKDERNPKFRYSVFGQLLVKLGRFCEEINVITYNGSRFDLINILAPLFYNAKAMDLDVAIGRKGTEIRFLKIGHICFYDLFKLSTEASLKHLGDMLDISSRTRDGLEKEYTIPYTHFTAMAKLYDSDVPPIDDQSWSSMKDGTSMCSPEEHASVVTEVKRIGWWAIFSRYLRNDCDLTLGCLVAMTEIYREHFGVDMLGPSFTSAGSVVAAHLEESTNAKGVQGYCEIRNGTVGRILLNARNGGVVESRVVKATKIWERENELDAAKIFCLDVNSLYPSVQAIHNNPYGEYTVYSPLDPSNSELLSATSNFNPYGNEYKACAMLRHELEDRYGELVLSMRSNHSNQRIAVLPRYWPDSFAVTKNIDGKVVLTLHQHDGYYHVMIPNLHSEGCRFHTDDNDVRWSPKYQLTMQAFQRHREYCETVFGPHYQLRFVQTTDCAFHSPYTMSSGRTFPNMTAALTRVRRERPELCISAAHPSRLTVGEIVSEKERADGTVLTGFAVIKASYDPVKHLKTGQFGFMVESSAITKDMLSPWTRAEIQRVARLQTSDSAEAEAMVSKFYDSLPSTRRLHMRNSHSRWVTVTLDHLRFLRSIGGVIEAVAHVILFASLTRESQREHPHRAQIEVLLRRRQDLQLELTTLKKLANPTSDELRRMSLLKTLIFLAKIW
jgi:hypothetical protein